MLMRLSMAWGRNYRDLACELTADDIGMYEAWYSVEPWGCIPEDYRTAIVAHTSAAVMGGRGKLSDFLPQWGGKKALSWSQAQVELTAWAARSQRG